MMDPAFCTADILTTIAFAWCTVFIFYLKDNNASEICISESTIRYLMKSERASNLLDRSAYLKLERLRDSRWAKMDRALCWFFFMN
jgi:hypothetical protein